MDHVADKVHKEHHELVTNHISVDIEGFLDGPHDTSMLMLYADHVAAIIWEGEIVICLIITYLNNYLSF